MSDHPTKAGRAEGVVRTYDGYHLAFALGIGCLAVSLIAGFRYTLMERKSLPGVRLNAFDQAERQLASGDRFHAAQQFRMAARISPWDLDTALRLARTTADAAPPEAQMVAWAPVLAIDARNVEAHLRVGNSLVRAGRLQEAVDRFLQARAAAPERLDVALRLGDALLDQGHPDAAAQAYRRVLPQHASSAELHNALGVASARAGRFGDAIVEFRAALTLSPDPTIIENLERARVDGARATGPS